MFNTGVRPIIDGYIEAEAQKRRDYGQYWSASSAGYCKRKVIFDRLQVKYTTDPIAMARKQRVFSAGHIFHEWVQSITKKAGVSIEQETELIHEKLKIKGHIDDIINIGNEFVLYDYKTRNSKSFHYAKRPSELHRMQLGTYMMMLGASGRQKIKEARVLNISKDDLRMTEVVYEYTPELEQEVISYWEEVNRLWSSRTIPECTCASIQGGFMAKQEYNPYFYNNEPCSLEWFNLDKEAVRKWNGK